MTVCYQEQDSILEFSASVGFIHKEFVSHGHKILKFIELYLSGNYTIAASGPLSVWTSKYDIRY